MDLSLRCQSGQRLRGVYISLGRNGPGLGAVKLRYKRIWEEITATVFSIKTKWLDILFKLDLSIFDTYCIHETFNYYKWKSILTVWINLTSSSKKCLCILSFGHHKSVTVWFLKKIGCIYGNHDPHLKRGAHCTLSLSLSFIPSFSFFHFLSLPLSFIYSYSLFLSLSLS